MSSPSSGLQVFEKEKFSQNLVYYDLAEQNLLPKHLKKIANGALADNYNTLKKQNKDQ